MMLKKHLLQFTGNNLFVDGYKGGGTSVLRRCILAREEASISRGLASC